MKKLKSKHGFTMVELIVVIVIILVLSAVLVPSLLKYIDKAQRAKAKDDCRTCVVVAQGLLVEIYVSDDPDLTLDPEMVRKGAGASGEVSGIEVSTEPELLHLAYQGGKYKVTYCARPHSCAKHDEQFNFEDADGSGSSGGSGESDGGTGGGSNDGGGDIGGGTNGGGAGDDTGGGGSGAGSVTLKDSDGKEHVLKVNRDWEEIKEIAKNDGVSIKNGTILSDSTGAYLMYGDNDWFTSAQIKSDLKSFAESNPGRIIKINTDNPVFTDVDLNNQTWKKEPKAGDIMFRNGDYYVATTDLGLNEIYPGKWILIPQ